MLEQNGNLFTQENIQEITDILKVDVSDDDHNVFQAKVTAMQRLLRYGMSKFSKEKLYQHLCIISRRVSVQDRMRSWSAETQTVLKSMEHLKIVLHNLQGKDKFNGLLESERHAIRYFQYFLVDVNHLKYFKETFDSEVHTVLYYDFYDPNLVSASQRKRDGKKTKSVKNNGNNASARLGNDAQGSQQGGVSPKGDISPRSKDDNMSNIGFSVSKHLDGSEREKLHVTMKELEEVSQRWNRMLLEENQDLEDFDPESSYEVMECSEYTKFEVVFRLLPDIFAKCYKVIELSKQWWNLAHKVYEKLPLRRPVTREIPQNLEILSKKETKTENKETEDETKEEKRDEDEVNSQDEKEDSVKFQEQNSESSHTELGNMELSLHESKQDGFDSDIPGESEDEEGSVRSFHQAHQALDPQKPHPIPDPQKHQKQDRIRNIKVRLFDLTYAMKEGEGSLKQMKVDLRNLDCRERHFQMLEILHGKVDANLEDVQEKLRKLRAQRKVTAQKYSYTFRGTEKYFEYRDKLRRIDKKLVKYDQDIQILVYKKNVVSQDYLLEMEIRPNFIRSYDDLRTGIAEQEYFLQQRKIEKKDLEEELELLEPDGLVGRSRRSEHGSNSGNSDMFDFKSEISVENIIDEDAALAGVTRFSDDGSHHDVFSGLGKLYELVSSAPPTKTQLKDKGKITVKKPEIRNDGYKSVTTIDGSNLNNYSEQRFRSPRPPVGVKRRTRKHQLRRPVKPVQ